MKIILVAILAVVMAEAEETSVENLLQRSNNHFTSKMFSEVAKANPGKSVVMSGFSVLTPLAQLSLASEGYSHDELLRAMALPNDNATEDIFRFVNTNLRAVKGVDLRMASRVYVAQRYELNENLQNISRDLFSSEVRNVDFAESKATAAEINNWVEDQTNKRIKDLVSPDSLDSDTRAVLVNAIYFKGTWADKFDSAKTTDRDFHVTKEKTIKVPTMARKGDYDYTESKELNAKLLRLPYLGYEASMLIVLPNQIDGLAALEEKLKDPEALPKAIAKMYTFDVDVRLPKLKIETTINLKEVLENIDVKGIFGPETAQLNRLLKGEKSDNGLYVSEATQKAFIEVNEEGAEAAAANEFGAVATSLVIVESRTFIADHPFVFYLYEGNISLFEGIYSA